MKQRTHTWLAIRAIALLEDEGDSPKLVKLLKPHTRSAAIGSWIPDMADSKKGFGDIDNHIFKLKPYSGVNPGRFVKSKLSTLQRLGSHRQMGKFIRDWSGTLDSTWWDQSYRADPPPGQHLANRSMALYLALIDQLILGDKKVASLVPGTVRFAHNLGDDARPRSEEIATYCFMLSHFIADSCQPMHCDARRMAGYSAGIHKELEAYWNKGCGTYFDKKKLLNLNDSPNTILKKAKEVDIKIGINFSNQIPKLKEKDLWLEIVNICRASFVVSSILVDPNTIPYGSAKKTTFEKIFKTNEVSPDLLPELSKAVLHDSVLNIAIAWKDLWNKFN